MASRRHELVLLSLAPLLAGPAIARAQDCLGLPLAPARRAIGAVYDPLNASEKLLAGQYRQVHDRLAWGFHLGGIVRSRARGCSFLNLEQEATG